MTEPAAQQRVFIVRGLRKILEVVAADILVCEKMTWARVGTKRFLLGTSAFYTRNAAEKRKLGELRKLAARNYPLWHQAGRACDAARAQLKVFAETRVLH